MSEDHALGPNGEKRVYIRSADRNINNETSRSIRKVMEVIEKYTNYEDIDDDVKCIVRDTVLNQINGLVRRVKHKQTIVFGEQDRR